MAASGRATMRHTPSTPAELKEVVVVDELELDLTQFRSYESWMTEGPRDFHDFLNINANLELAAAFAKLFWPEFIEVQGCILLREKYSPDNFTDWWQHFDGSRTGVEGIINHVHIYDLFLNNKSGSHEFAIAAFLGHVLRRCWKYALQESFPDRTFEVDYEPGDAEGNGPELSLWQI